MPRSEVGDRRFESQPPRAYQATIPKSFNFEPYNLLEINSTFIFFILVAAARSLSVSKIEIPI